VTHGVRFEAALLALQTASSRGLAAAPWEPDVQRLFGLVTLAFTGRLQGADGETARALLGRLLRRNDPRGVALPAEEYEGLALMLLDAVRAPCAAP